MIKLIISEYPNNLSFDLLGFDPTKKKRKKKKN